MIVTVRPIGREEYALTTDGPPIYGSADGGYEQAQVVCELDDEQRLACLGGRLRIHGDSGIVWQGIITRRPGRGEPLLAKGWGWCGALGRRSVTYAKNDFASSMIEYDAHNAAKFYRRIADNNIQIAFSIGQTSNSGDQAGYRYLGSDVLTNITASMYVSAAAYHGRLHSLDEGGNIIGTPIDNNTPGWTTYTAAALTAGTYGIIFELYDDGATTAHTTMDYQVQLNNPTLYGMSGSITTQAILYDVCSDEIDTDYLTSGSAYLSYIAADTTTFDNLYFNSVDANTKIDEVKKHSAYRFGWYMEDISGIGATCVPHWTAISTTPDYVLNLDDYRVQDYDIDEASLDELISVARVSYQTAEGRSVYKDVTDTDASHPLVQLGITRYGEVGVGTTSSATASAVGVVALADGARAQVKGTVTTEYLATAYGADVYLPDVRPGQMVRVMGGSLPDGYKDCIVKRTTLVGDTVATIELDNEPYALDILLARLSRNGA